MYRTIFRNSKHLHGKVVMPISCGSLRQDSEFLKATISEMKSRFLDYHIVLADTLQHYTLEMKGYHESQLMAKTLGDQWISRNQQYIDTRIIRWDDCCKDSEFETSLQDLKTIYNDDSLYQKLVNQDVHTFINRHRSVILYQNAELLSRNYILEETAVLMSFFRSQGYHYMMYPGNLPTSIDIINQYYVNLPKSIKITFKKL